MKGMALAGVLLLLSVFSFGQENLLAWNERKLLSWEDFSGKAADTSHFDAETFGDVKYTYKFNGPNNFSFDVQAFFDRSASWIKEHSKSESLLRHEQVHFDIAQLYACKLRVAFYSFQYTSNFKKEIEDIAAAIGIEYHRMQELYDEETNHSTISHKQKIWEQNVSKLLRDVNDQQKRLTLKRDSDYKNETALVAAPNDLR